MSHIAPVSKTTATATARTEKVGVNTKVQITKDQMAAVGENLDRRLNQAPHKREEPLAKRLLDAGMIQDNGFYTAAGVVLTGAMALGGLFVKAGSTIRNGPSTAPETVASNVRSTAAKLKSPEEVGHGLRKLADKKL